MHIDVELNLLRAWRAWQRKEIPDEQYLNHFRVIDGFHGRGECARNRPEILARLLRELHSTPMPWKDELAKPSNEAIKVFGFPPKFSYDYIPPTIAISEPAGD